MVCCSPKCMFITQIALYSLFLVLDGLSGAACFAVGSYIPGIGFALASILIVVFIIIRARLGYKTISELVAESLEQQGLTAVVINNPEVRRSRVVSIEASFEEDVIERRTVFRSSPGAFMPFAIIMLVAFIAATIFYLVKAIESHDRFDLLEEGNAWVPFIAYLSGIGPSSDILKLLVNVRKEKREYFLDPVV